jgi:uncharacterized protein (TIGR02271 family)
VGDPIESDDANEDARSRASSSGNSGDYVGKLSLFAEELSVGKETVETGRLHVSKHTVTREVGVDEDLTREEAVVETVPRGHRIFVVPVTRVVGDTTIIPIVEEVLHTEKRLILKEEIHITRRRTTEHFHDTVTLRHQQAVVTRDQGATGKPDAVSENKTDKPQE